MDINLTLNLILSKLFLYIYILIICLKMNYMTCCIILYQINRIILVLFFFICYSKHMKNTKHGVSPHFSIEALKQRYLECECPRERMRWHAIWLLADTENPKTPREVADIVGCTADCVRNFAGTIKRRW